MSFIRNNIIFRFKDFVSFSIRSVRRKTTHTLYVHTGDKKGAGTDANVSVVVYDDKGNASPEIELDRTFRNDLERGCTDSYPLPELSNFSSVKKIEFWRDNFGTSPDWFVDSFHVDDLRNVTPNRYSFPIQRWIKADYRYTFYHLDCFLPQDDPNPSQRRSLLEEKKMLYNLEQKAPNMPAQIKHVPADEQFSDDYKWDIVTNKLKLLSGAKLSHMLSVFDNWTSFSDLCTIYRAGLEKPQAQVDNWQSDEWFGQQRLSGCNPLLIQLCTQVPEKFGVTGAMVEPFLEGLTLEEAISKKRVFYIDLEILKDLPCKEGMQVCAPLAMFFVTRQQKLVPIAIQLFQEKGENNPVFLPSDPPYTWLLAKMWYNNADGSYHQSLTHLGFTHLLMEGVSIVTHRNLSTSHPIFKLLAPHFLFLVAINSRGLNLLVSENGWVDKTMTIGRSGMFELIARGINIWQMNVHGTLPKDLKTRGVLDTSILPNYYFRDDALLVYDAIKNYVTKIVNYYYESPTKISTDYELQDWASELVKPRESGGVGIKGVPGNGTFGCHDDLISVLTSIIYSCSVAHASSNFPQYDDYAFPPNYPAYITGQPIRTKEPRTEADIIQSLPTKAHTLDIMVVTKLLSMRGTNPLGDFEVQYMYDPMALKAVEEFRAELKEISKTIKERNQNRFPKYDYLDPDVIPNSISI